MRYPFRTIIGIFSLSIIIAMLFSFPSTIFARGVSMLDTNYENSTGKGMFVRTKMDFADSQYIKSFPVNLNEWVSSQYDASRVEKTLQADAVMARAYHHPTSSDPIFFYIIQSPDPSAFHPPPVCYRSLGFEILDDRLVRLPIANIQYWAQKPMYEVEETFKDWSRINVNRLVIAKESDGQVIDKRVVLYYYVKDDWLSSPKNITMIRISALVPPDGSYDDMLQLEEQLLSDTFPIMFEPRSNEKTLAKWLTTDAGILGWMGFFLLLAIPLGVIALPVIPVLKRSRFSRPS